MSAHQAEDMLGDSVAVYLEGDAQAATEPAPPSTIVDYTVTPPRVVRAGAISVEKLREADQTILDIDGNPAPQTEPDTPDAGEHEPGETLEQ